jgi:hypothetical protein
MEGTDGSGGAGCNPSTVVVVAGSAHPRITTTGSCSDTIPRVTNNDHNTGDKNMSSSSLLSVNSKPPGNVASSTIRDNPVHIAATTSVPALAKEEDVNEKKKSSHQVSYAEHEKHPMDEKKNDRDIVMSENDDDFDDTMREDDDDDGSENVIRESSTIPIVSNSMHETTKKTTTFDSSTLSSPLLIVGGSMKEDALALLDGRNEETGKQTTVPIRTMPIILGRTHETNDDSNFVGMGKDAKAMSRQHVRIDYYYMEEGGTGVIEVLYKNGKFEYQESEIQERDILNHEKQNDSIGFFAITVLGKNRILVNRKRVEKGQTCRLRDGDAIRISSFCLYFLVPDEKPNVQILEIDIISSKTSNKRCLSGVSTGSSSYAAATTSVSPSKPHVSAMVKRNKTIQQDIESLSTEELLDLMTEAIERNIWDRRHQLVGSTLSYRAVLEAAEAPNFENHYELSRTEVMDHIAEMPKFKQFVEQMLTKVEAKSYQASITKAMIKAGFSRTANSGRYIKWIIPEHLRYNSAKKRSSSSSSSPKKQTGDDDKHKKTLQTEKQATTVAEHEDVLDDDDNEQSMDDED